jgi:hypothetical protein
VKPTVKMTTPSATILPDAIHVMQLRLLMVTVILMSLVSESAWLTFQTVTHVTKTATVKTS